MKNHNFHSYKRVRQAMALHDKLSEDGLGIYEQQVLIFLGSMMAHETKKRWTVINSCYPTVSAIAKGCHAKPTRTNKALKLLVEKGYLTRDDFEIRGVKRIRYTLVEAVWDTAWTKKTKTESITDNRVPPPASAAEQAVLKELDNKPAQKDSELPKQKIDNEPVDATHTKSSQACVEPPQASSKTLLTPEEGTRNLTLKIYRLLGYGEPAEAELTKEAVRLLPKVLEGEYKRLGRMITFAFGRPEENPFWINLFRQHYTKVPVVGFLNKFNSIEEQYEKHAVLQARASLPQLQQVQQPNRSTAPQTVSELPDGIQKLLERMQECAV